MNDRQGVKINNDANTKVVDAYAQTKMEKVLCFLLFVFKDLVLVRLSYNIFYSIRLQCSLAFLLFIVVQPIDMHRLNLCGVNTI